MYKFVLVANVILQAIDAKQLYLCMYGPDANGEYFEEVVNDAMRARSCQDYPDFCLCQEIQVKCMFGPDATGDFVIEPTTQQFSQECDRAFCTCTNHEDYQEVANERMK